MIKKVFLSFSSLFLIALFPVADAFAHLNPPPAAFSKSDSLQTVIEDSFSHRDHGGTQAIKLFNSDPKNNKILNEYSGNFDFKSIDKDGDSQFPWRNGPFFIDGQTISKLNLNVPSHAKLFSDLVFQYILEGWFTNESGQKIIDPDNHFRNNLHRTWCTTPGVVDGDGGRDAVHGLTKELGLKPNPLFPAGQGNANFNESLWNSANKPLRPAGWGQPFYNSVVCEKYDSIFASVKDNQMPIMNDPQLLENQMGFVSFKLHFNAMENGQSYQPFEGAYSWMANVGSSIGEKNRKLQSIPLIQISVSMKVDPGYVDGLVDDKGRPKADYWVMLAYYHDANFNSAPPSIPHLPEALNSMRPMGVQIGFTPSGTIMFEGAKSNYKMNLLDSNDKVIGHQWHENDSETLLNGPADNAYSSCLGCHAGFSYMDVLNATDPRRGGADGLSFFDVDSFDRVIEQNGKRVDFNLQLFNVFNRLKSWIENND